MKIQQPVKKAKKGLVNVIFSRVTIMAVLLLVQIVILIATLTHLKDYATYIYAALMVLEVVCVIYIINSKSNPDFKIMWIMLIFVLPVFGSAM